MTLRETRSRSSPAFRLARIAVGPPLGGVLCKRCVETQSTSSTVRHRAPPAGRAPGRCQVALPGGLPDRAASASEWVGACPSRAGLLVLPQQEQVERWVARHGRPTPELARGLIPRGIECSPIHNSRSRYRFQPTFQRRGCSGQGGKCKRSGLSAT